MVEDVVPSTVSSDSETRILKATERRVEVFDIKCLRRVLGLNVLDIVRHDVIRERRGSRKSL